MSPRPRSPRAAGLAAPVAALAAALLIAAPLLARTPPSAPARPRVLVLTSGEVYGGTVTEYSYGLKVAGPKGSIVLPRDRVRANAATLDGAFLALRAETPADDAAARADLAAWCLSHGLPLRSREELLAALELDPHRDDWSRMLRRVESVIAASATRTARRDPAVAPAAHTAPATASAGGLSPESMRLFAGRVERILLMRCGNAGCHGGAGAGAFHLKNPSRSATTTRQNLAAALAFVGDGGGWSSPLLTACVDRPDRRGRTPFRVQGGPASRAALAAWVARIAAERPDLAARQAPPALRQAGEKTLGESAGAAPSARPIQPDVFDPAEFNRTFAAPAPRPVAPRPVSLPSGPSSAAPFAPPAAPAADVSPFAPAPELSE